MSPQPTAIELYKELQFEFSFWKDFAMSREYPLPLMDVWIEDYKTMVSLYNAAKCAGLEAAKLSECYFQGYLFCFEIWFPSHKYALFWVVSFHFSLSSI